MTDVPRTAPCPGVSGDWLGPLSGLVNDGPAGLVTGSVLLVLFVATAQIPAVPRPPPAGATVRHATALR
ncbi:MAG: hypothetical protein WD794_07395 [Mycobacteriales bacterium]